MRTLRTRPGRTSAQSEKETSKEPTNSRPNDAANEPSPEQQPQSPPIPSPDQVSSALADIDPSQNGLLAPVHIPEDANAVLRSDHPATSILSHSGLVVTRQMEMMNILLSFEQASKYVILDPHGNHVGYMAEEDGGIAKTMSRQALRLHRPFTTFVFDKHAREVLRFYRPFTMIKSRLRVYDPLEAGNYPTPTPATGTDVSSGVKDPASIHHELSSLPMDRMRIIGEAHSEWAAMRRKYNLFLSHDLAAQNAFPSITSETLPLDQTKSLTDLVSSVSSGSAQPPQTQNFNQFAYIDEAMLSWDFALKGPNDELMGSINRNLRGLLRDIFTDTGMYAVRYDGLGERMAAEEGKSLMSGRQLAERETASLSSKGLTLDQRAVMLATAVTIDFDYFSRHSSHASGGIMPIPLWIPGGGGAAAEAGAVGAGVGAAEAGGAVAGAAGRGVAGAAGAGGIGEGAIAGAGTMAGYEAMQRAAGRRGDDSESPIGGEGVGVNDPNSPQYGAAPESESMQDGYGGGTGVGDQDGEVWGSGESDPWQEGSSGGSGSGGGGDGEGGGGILSWISDFFDN